MVDADGALRRWQTFESAQEVIDRTLSADIHQSNDYIDSRSLSRFGRLQHRAHGCYSARAAEKHAEITSLRGAGAFLRL
jgi:hypothetical protein